MCKYTTNSSRRRRNKFCSWVQSTFFHVLSRSKNIHLMPLFFFVAVLSQSKYMLHTDTQIFIYIRCFFYGAAFVRSITIFIRFILVSTLSSALFVAYEKYRGHTKWMKNGWSLLLPIIDKLHNSFLILSTFFLGSFLNSIAI